MSRDRWSFKQRRKSQGGPNGPPFASEEIEEKTSPDPARKGAPYQPSILERAVNVYLISESELSGISSTNPWVTLFISASLAFAAAGGSFWIGGETAGENVSKRAEAVFDIVPIVAGIAAFLFACTAIGLWRSGKSMLNRIKEESRRPAQLVAPKSE